MQNTMSVFGKGSLPDFCTQISIMNYTSVLNQPIHSSKKSKSFVQWFWMKELNGNYTWLKENSLYSLHLPSSIGVLCKSFLFLLFLRRRQNSIHSYDPHSVRLANPKLTVTGCEVAYLRVYTLCYIHVLTFALLLRQQSKILQCHQCFANMEQKNIHDVIAIFHVNTLASFLHYLSTLGQQVLLVVQYSVC